MHLMSDARSRAAVEVAERYADGLATEGERKAALKAAAKASDDQWPQSPKVNVWRFLAAGAAANAVEADDDFIGPEAELFYLASNPLDAIAGEKREKGLELVLVLRDESVALVALLRDICGNPFRPVSFDPGWRTSTVVALARQMYESRDFAPMPVLADALQDAGCEHPDVLAHCRGAGPHVRGCWVVALLLGKE